MSTQQFTRTINAPRSLVYTTLLPNERVVEVDEFETDNPELQGAMTIRHNSHPTTQNVANSERALLDALLDSWDRNNTILVNLLRAIPEEHLHLRPIETSPSISALFAHMHYVRLIFVAENAPESAVPVPEREWLANANREGMAELLNASARTVRDAVNNKLTTGGAMDLYYDHPLLFLQHMIWHDGYHHGQIKLTLKLAGHPMDDEEIGTLTWDLWMNKA